MSCSKVTLAEVIEFESWPPEKQDLAKRVIQTIKDRRYPWPTKDGATTADPNQ